MGVDSPPAVSLCLHQHFIWTEIFICHSSSSFCFQITNNDNFICVCMCDGYTCLYVCLCAHVHICVHVRGSQRSIYLSPLVTVYLISLRKSFLLNPEFPSGWQLATELLSTLPESGIIVVCYHAQLCMWMLGWNSGPQSSYRQPSPQSIEYLFMFIFPPVFNTFCEGC